MNEKLVGRHAIVMGGTSGMGLATARALAADGAQITIVGRSVTAQMADQFPEASTMYCDLADADSVSKLVSSIRQIEPDIMILNSGGPPPADATDVSREALSAALSQLFLAQVELSQAALAGMRKKGWGRIVAIGSSGIRAPISSLTPSNSARAALAAFLKTLATEVAEWGITVNMVLPGRIDTDRVRQLDSSRAEINQTSADEEKSKSVGTIPMGRYGSPDEFAAAIRFLCQPSASFITGTHLLVDGGMLRGL